MQCKANDPSTIGERDAARERHKESVMKNYPANLGSYPRYPYPVYPTYPAYPAPCRSGGPCPLPRVYP